MKTIARTHIKKLAAVRALPLLVVAHSTDIYDSPTQEWGTLTDAWARYDSWDHLSVFDREDGSYEIGTKYSSAFYLFPEGHRLHTEMLNRVKRAEEFAAKREAKRLADMEAERAAYVAPEGQNGELINAVSIKIEWSECGLFDDNQVFSGADCWAQVDAISNRARAALINSGRGGYDKTKFVITFADGQTYSGRWDIAANDHDGRTLADHVLSCLRFYAGETQPDHLSTEDYAHCVHGKGAEATAFLNTYRIGAAPVVAPVTPTPTPAPVSADIAEITEELTALGFTGIEATQTAQDVYAVRVPGLTLSSGRPMILTGSVAQVVSMAARRAPVAPAAPLEMTAAELHEIQNAVREEFAGVLPTELVERALQITAQRVHVIDHNQGAVWLDAPAVPTVERVLN